MIRQSWRYLAAHRLIAALTAAGIAVALSCILTVSFLSGSLSRSLAAGIGGLGLDNRTLSVTDTARLPRDWVRPLKAAGILREAGWTRSRTIAKGEDTLALIEGDEGYYAVLGLEAAQGRPLAGYDRYASPSSALIGAKAAARLAQPDFILGGRLYHTVGILSESSGDLSGSREWSVYALAEPPGGPGTFLMAYGPQGSDRIFEAYLAAYYSEDEYQLTSLAELAGQLAALIRLSDRILTVISGISLAVALIGLASVSYVTARQREAEWGIRKAVGAARKEIVAQILIESAAIALIGWAAGAALSLALGLSIAKLLGISYRIDWGLALGSGTLAVAAGALCGLLPGLQAARTPADECFRE